MKKLLFAALLLFPVVHLFAQKDPVTVAGHWKKTDMRDYKVTKISTRWGDSDRMLSDTVSYTFRFIVLDSTANGYRIQWQFEDTPLADELTGDEYEDLANQSGDLQLIYTTDKRGAFKAVENWQEVSNYFTSYYNIKYTDEPAKDSTTVIEKYKRLKDAITTRQGVETALFNEMRLLHMVYAYNNMMAGDTIKYDVKGQLEPTDQYAPEHVKYYESRANRETGEGEINLKGMIDTAEAYKKLQAIMKDYIASLPETSDQEKKDKAEASRSLSQLQYENTDDVTCYFNYKTGFTSKIYLKHTLSFDFEIDKDKTTKEIIIEKL